MLDIEEFKLAHKDELLQHSLHDIVVLSGKFDYEAQYTIMQMNNYLYDIKHVIEQKMDVSIISHLTYNLNLQFLHCYNQANDYYEASRYCLLGDFGIDILKLINDYQEESKKIKDQINGFNDVGFFDIYSAHPNDFLKEYHYRKGIENKNKQLINLERELAFMNGVQLLKCLVYLMELTEKKILDIRNGITYESKETLELVYDLNYVFYADNYWADKRSRYRYHVEHDELIEEVTPQGLHNCYRQILDDFKTNKVGRVWDENDGNKSELTYELKRLPLSIEQWEYFFNNIFKLEELKLWISELKHPAKSNNTLSTFVVRADLANIVVTKIVEYVNRESKPKDIVRPIRAAMDAGVLNRPSWDAFVHEFGPKKISSKASFSDYTNPERKPYYGESYKALVDDFKKLLV